VREHDNEPVPGLPENLPNDERILWQGAPGWRAIARRVMHIRAVAIYLALIVFWGTTSAIANHQTATDVAIFALKLSALSVTALAALAFYARLIARSTLYTLTNRRVVMRFGVALPMTINIPLKTIKSADLKVYRDGSGDLPLALSSERRQSIVVLWPHVRPWRTTKPQPMLRSIPNASDVAQLLRTALTAVSTERSEIRIRIPRAAVVKTAPHVKSDEIAAA
jgi:hypothetical protein